MYVCIPTIKLILAFSSEPHPSCSRLRVTLTSGGSVSPLTVGRGSITGSRRGVTRPISERLAAVYQPSRQFTCRRVVGAAHAKLALTLPSRRAVTSKIPCMRAPAGMQVYLVPNSGSRHGPCSSSDYRGSSAARQLGVAACGSREAGGSDPPPPPHRNPLMAPELDGRAKLANGARKRFVRVLITLWSLGPIQSALVCFGHGGGSKHC